MLKYGARRNLYGYDAAYATRPWHIRGNRGRNRTSAVSWSHDHRSSKFVAPAKSEATSNRGMSKRARQRARKEIHEELHYRWLESQLSHYPTILRGSYAYLKEIATDSELFSAIGDAMLERELHDDTQMDDDYTWEDIREAEQEASDDEKWWRDVCGLGRALYDLHKVDPSSSEWRDLWVAGAVSSDDLVERDYADCRWDYEDDMDHYDECEDAWEAIRAYERNKYGPDVDPAVRADSERNVERLRAGERYYRQHRRTTIKEGSLVRVSRAGA